MSRGQRIEGIDGHQAASAVETFAEALARAPGVWAVTVKECRLGTCDFEMHLIVHGDMTEEEAENLFPPSGWWT